MKTMILIFVFFAAGCHEELNLRIDTNCTPEQRADIESAIIEINNAWYGCHGGNGIELTGDAEIDSYDLLKWESDSDDVVACVPDGERILMEFPDDVNGASTYGGNVILFISRIPDGEFRAVAIHELGHYIGMGHSDDPTSVMYGEGVEVEHLSDGDIDTMCRMD